MSFFRDVIDEFKREMEKAQAEFGVQQSMNPTQGKPVYGSYGTVNSGMGGQTRVSMSTGTDGRTASSQRPAQSKKTRKKAPPQQQQIEPGIVTPTGQAAPKTQTVIPPSRAHKTVANLNPQSARNAIILSEVLGPPVSKRQNRRVFH